MISDIARTATGKIKCFIQSIVASQVPGVRSALTMPEVGNQPSLTEKSDDHHQAEPKCRNRIGDKSHAGQQIVADRILPHGGKYPEAELPSVLPMTTAETVSTRVFFSAGQMISNTGWPYSRE